MSWWSYYAILAFQVVKFELMNEGGGGWDGWQNISTVRIKDNQRG